MKPVPCNARLPAWHEQFVAMLPTIRNYARSAFGHLDRESRDDAVEEVVAKAFVAFARLVELDKVELAFATVLARYGIAQFRDGRRVGSSLRIRDVLSPYAQRKKRFVVERLDHFDKDAKEWGEAIVEDHRTPVPDQVAFRIDFPSRRLQTSATGGLQRRWPWGTPPAKSPGDSRFRLAGSANSVASSTGRGRGFMATRPPPPSESVADTLQPAGWPACERLLSDRRRPTGRAARRPPNGGRGAVALF